MWISTELNVPVLTVWDSPQSGKTTRKLVNIQRGKPDPALFQPPADYTIKDNTAQN
jgi:hypothetical protein